MADESKDPPAADLFPANPPVQQSEGDAPERKAPAFYITPTGSAENATATAGGAAPADTPEPPRSRRTRARLTEPPKPADRSADKDEEIAALRRENAILRERLNEPLRAAAAPQDVSLTEYECWMPADKTVRPTRVKARTPGDAKEEFLKAIGAISTENEIKVREV